MSRMRKPTFLEPRSSPTAPGEMMSTKQPEQRPSEQQEPEVRRLEALVGDNVLSDLGRPDELRHIQVRHVWGNRYRVNVFVGPDAAALTVAHSYFLEADATGKIVTSSPVITKTY